MTRYSGPQCKRKVKNLVVISAEGHVTEKEYFEDVLRGKYVDDQLMVIKVLPHHCKSSYRQIRERMEQHLSQNPLEAGVSAWIVADKIPNKDAEVEDLISWAEGKDLSVAISYPNFDYWILLHFEDGTKINSNSCKKRLNVYFGDYKKSLDPKKFTQQYIDLAIDRSKAKHKTNGGKWPKSNGSTVYRLVEHIKKHGFKK